VDPGNGAVAVFSENSRLPEGFEIKVSGSPSLI